MCYNLARKRWSLPELLARFKNLQLIASITSLQSLRLHFDSEAARLGGGSPISPENVAAILSALKSARSTFISVGFNVAADRARMAALRIESPSRLDHSGASEQLRTVEETAFADAEGFCFLQIQHDRAEFFPSTVVPMSTAARFDFGKDVRDAFPSATEDINEAGYCLAVEANTAAVYHLICAAEHGLRALAKDRRVVFPRGPIELQQWGDIIAKLEKEIAQIPNWPKSLARESALEFYGRTVKECRFFNEAYRRHIAHARRHYDRNEGLTAMNHARDFMCLLATKISDRKRTPLVWKTA